MTQQQEATAHRNVKVVNCLHNLMMKKHNIKCLKFFFFIVLMTFLLSY